ncbi:MAG: bile acid:sodium symporter family protein [Eubacteriales bacterium]|nr:bile acid:sodium symporter family protein [Eubacteriales bacterium]
MLKSLNTFLEKWMMLTTPLCLMIGVLFPEIAGKGVPYVPYLFAVMTFIGGLKSDFRDITGVLKHPLPLLLSMLSLRLLVPLLALFTGHLIFPDNLNLITGIVLEFIVPGAVVAIMWTSIYHGNTPLILSLVVVDTILAPLTVPLTLHVLLGSDVAIDTMDMMRQLLIMVALPAVAAMGLNELTRGRTKKTLPGKLALLSKFCLFLVVISNSSKISGYVRHMTAEHVLVTGVILMLAVSGYLLGWILAVLSRREYETKVAMVFGSGMRNISSGAVIAATYFPAEVVFPVMIGTVFQQILAAFFGTLLSRANAGKQN